MRAVGHIATYPARMGSLARMLTTISDQFEEIFVVLNEYDDEKRAQLPEIWNVRYHIPDVDLKDTGKFLFERTPDDYVFMMDDDIAFPYDYVSKLISFHEKLPTRQAVVGLHGVVYSDLFEGAPSSRFVAKFDKALARPMVVNQLGTGCVMVPGALMPGFEIMRTSQRFVDVRFARYCHERRIAMVCMARTEGWLRDLEPEESIFESYTRVHHKQHLEEIELFGGFGRIQPALAAAVDRL